MQLARVLIIAAIAVGFASGCVVVKPWQRGRLATSVMSQAVDPEELSCEVVFVFSREGSGKAAGGVGAGCACN